MAQRLQNLINAVSESSGKIGATCLSALGCTAYTGVFIIYSRSEQTSAVSLGVLGLTITAIAGMYLNALSQGSTKIERSASVSQSAPLMTHVLNLGLLFSFTILLAGDAAAAHFDANPKHLYVALGVLGSMTAISVIAAFSWVINRINDIAHQKLPHHQADAIEKIEITQARAPSVSLRYSEKDRKRKAAHFAGRVMCFAGSPYLDDDFDFEINEQFAEITYRNENTFEDEDFLYWMLFQLLCGQQAEVAFAKSTSKISWEHYGDIEHYAAEVLAARPGASRIIKNPKTAAELDWRAKRIRFLVKEVVPRVQSFLRTNQDQLRSLARSAIGGSLEPQGLRSVLRTVDTSHLPGHWDKQKSSRTHLTLVSS